MVQETTRHSKHFSREKVDCSVRFTSAGKELSAVERAIIQHRVEEALAYRDRPRFGCLIDQTVYQCQDFLADSQVSETSVSKVMSRGMAPFSHLLSKEEEKELFQQMNCARLCLRAEAQQASKRKVPISRAKRILELDRLESDARRCLVESNMPLVLSMAKRMHIQGVDFGDVICEGNMALLRAVDGFDCSRGFKFSTYACRAILKSFARLAGKNNKYRLRFPTEFDPAYEKSNWKETQRQETAKYCTEELVKILRNNSALLTPTELAVIRGRFAFGQESKRKTLVEMGQVLGLTKERVRQIQKKAVCKLREALELKLTGG